MRLKILDLSFIVLFITSISCTEEVTIPNNDAPYYSEISTILIENYVNRSYIDFIGREPLDSEMVLEVTKLRDADLDFPTRRAMLIKLQTDTSYVFGDSSYRRAYYHRIYNLAKTRVLEGASDDEVGQDIGILKNQIYQDSLNGDWPAYNQHKAQLQKLLDVLACDVNYELGLIGIDTVFARMINNDIYDFINMNTFNYINATYDNLLYRYPTSAEFNKAYNVIESNQSELIFGTPASNKDEYVMALIASQEFYEGCIIWTYQTLLQRDPSTPEIAHHLSDFFISHDFQKIQLEIGITDEYAGFD